MPVIRVDVEYLPGVEDPEAITILKNLNILGYKSIRETRTAKSYEFSVEGEVDKAMGVVDEIASRILTNPVIQKYSLRVVKP
ncbi:MAG: phosphoribosylformylglycinamidine synthase subunit PurS [Candidatus Thermoplasmatota archaeon]|nr:phosphoribosylformylglycinamidine synthase subunit PurS [Candidatus Thermoplasmatota archaeon]